MRRRLLGSEHIDVAQNLNDLAVLLKTQGDYLAAEPLYRESLEVARRRLNMEHPLVASALSNLAKLLLDMGDHEAAEPLFREALETSRRLRATNTPTSQPASATWRSYSKRKGITTPQNRFTRKPCR